MRRGTPQNPRLAHSIPIVQNHRCSTTQWIPNKQHPVSWCLLAAPITAATLNLLRTCVSQIPALGSYVSSFLQIIDSDLRTQRNRKPMFTCYIYSYTWYLPERLTSSFFYLLHFFSTSSFMAGQVLVCLILVHLFLLSSVAKVGGEQPHEATLGPSASLPLGSSNDSGSHIVASVAAAPGDGRHRGHVTDKSVAGGGVILGGLAALMLAAVFSYIRVTRKKLNENPV